MISGLDYNEALYTRASISPSSLIFQDDNLNDGLFSQSSILINLVPSVFALPASVPPFTLKPSRASDDEDDHDDDDGGR